jgi:hypothetical protein
MGLASIPGVLLGIFLWFLYLAKWRDPDLAASRAEQREKTRTNPDY